MMDSTDVLPVPKAPPWPPPPLDENDKRLVVDAKVSSCKVCIDCNTGFEGCASHHRPKDEEYSSGNDDEGFNWLRPCPSLSPGSGIPEWAEDGYKVLPECDYEEGCKDDCDVEMVFEMENNAHESKADDEDEMTRFMQESRERMEELGAQMRALLAQVEHMKVEASEREMA